MKTEFLYFTKNDEIARVKKTIKKIEFLIPSWCEVLSFERYETDGDDSAASITSAKRYRRISINLYNTFFCAEKDQQTLIHELLHSQLHEIQDFTQVLLKGVKQSDSFAYDLLENQYLENLEFFIEGMAHIVNRLTEEGK